MINICYFRACLLVFLFSHTPPRCVYCLLYQFVSVRVTLYYYFLLNATKQHTHTLAFKRRLLLKLESYLKVRAVFCRGEFKQYIYKIREKKTNKNTANICKQRTIRIDLVQHTHTHLHTQCETIFTFQI